MKHVTLLLAVLLAGCVQRIGPADVAKAESLCTNNGGLRFIDVGPVAYDTHCNNNAQFTNITLNRSK
jgi:hypothetical protein